MLLLASSCVLLDEGSSAVLTDEVGESNTFFSGAVTFFGVDAWIDGSLAVFTPDVGESSL